MSRSPSPDWALSQVIEFWNEQSEKFRRHARYKISDNNNEKGRRCRKYFSSVGPMEGKSSPIWVELGWVGFGITRFQCLSPAQHTAHSESVWLGLTRLNLLVLTGPACFSTLFLTQSSSFILRSFSDLLQWSKSVFFFFQKTRCKKNYFPRLWRSLKHNSSFAGPIKFYFLPNGWTLWVRYLLNLRFEIS